jgi:hypothetical protein
MTPLFCIVAGVAFQPENKEKIKEVFANKLQRNARYACNFAQSNAALKSNESSQIQADDSSSSVPFFPSNVLQRNFKSATYPAMSLSAMFARLHPNIQCLKCLATRYAVQLTLHLALPSMDILHWKLAATLSRHRAELV